MWLNLYVQAVTRGSPTAWQALASQADAVRRECLGNHNPARVCTRALPSAFRRHAVLPCGIAPVGVLQRGLNAGVLVLAVPVHPAGFNMTHAAEQRLKNSLVTHVPLATRPKPLKVKSTAAAGAGECRPARWSCLVVGGALSGSLSIVVASRFEPGFRVHG
jgi:hypothetical protein